MLGCDDNFNSKCRPLIEDIIKRRKTVVVSQLVILETIHAIRSRVTETMLAKSKVDEFTRIIRKFSKQNKIAIVVLDKTIAEYYSVVLDKLKTYYGKIGFEPFCNICQRSYFVQNKSNLCPSCNGNLGSLGKRRYRGLGPADIEHAYFAHFNDVSTFYSTDKSFSDLSNDSDFGSITFVMP